MILTYPRIDAVTPGIRRPFWSVMIPTYNCGSFLPKTLNSVLAQDPGPEKMQIEVIDDCSTKDDPEKIVNEIGKGRISFYRHSANSGAVRNFNTCVSRSTGRFIHILHGDDVVEKGFYSDYEKAITDNPNTGFFTCRVLTIDTKGGIETINPRLNSLEKPSHDPEPFLYENPLWTPSLVINRDFYEKNGGFCESLAHVADWELCLRAIKAVGGYAINKPLAYYRSYEGNDTSILSNTAANQREQLLFAKYLAENNKSFSLGKFKLRKKYELLMYAKGYMEKGARTPAVAYGKLWWEILSLPEKAAVIVAALAYQKKDVLDVIKASIFSKSATI